VRKIVAALAIALCAVPIVAAGDTDRVRVGGSSATRAFSPRTHVVVTSPDDYVRTGFDGDHGDWRGPLCVVSSNASLSGEVAVSWSIGFSNRYRTAGEAADRGRTFRDLLIVQRAELKIPHRIRGKKVGSIIGEYVLAATRQEYGWAEIGLGIPLTRGVFVAARFWSTGPSFRCTVGGTASELWHLQAAQAAVARVVIDGNLPAARLTAYPQRRRVVGFVSDGFGHPLVGVQVTVERLVRGAWRRVGSAATDASGHYRAGTLPGTVRVTLGSLRSAPVRVR
jgi:hypothetical protein